MAPDSLGLSRWCIVVKKPTCQCRRHRDVGLTPVLVRSPGVEYSTPVFFLGESHGERGLAGYSPWGHNESDTTERLLFWGFPGGSEGKESTMWEI